MGRVIKVAPCREHLVPAPVATAREQAGRVLAEAEARARAVVAAAHRQATGIEQAAHRRALEAARAELAREHVELARARANATAEAERDVATLALAAATRLLRCELDLHPDKISAVVKPLLQMVRNARRVTMKVHPRDAPALRHWLQAQPGASELVHIDEDAGVARGGAVVDSDLGQLDARVETRIAALRHAWSIAGDE